LRHARQILVERRIEASDLHDSRLLPSELFDQRDLSRQVRKIETLVFTQFPEKVRGDRLMARQTNASVNDSMPDGPDAIEIRPLCQPVRETFGRLARRLRVDGITLVSRGAVSPHEERAVASADALDTARYEANRVCRARK
jgi:hypothetical protein